MNAHRHSFDEKDWNTTSIPACEKLGRGATGVDKYRGEFPINLRYIFDQPGRNALLPLSPS